MSGANDTPKTQTTASNEPSGNAARVMSPERNSICERPARRALSRPIASIRSERSMPMTLPVGPTRRAAGSDEAPEPQAMSSTVIPGWRPSRSIVRSPDRAQKPSAASS